MVTLVICFLWIYLVKGLEISVTDDLGEMYDCRKDNINYILKCSITPEALAGVVTWSKDAILLTTCSNVGDNMCVNTPGQSENRYTFTSSISQKEFLFRISSSEIGDDGTYTCEHLTVTKSFHIETCKCATQDVQNGQVTPSGAVVAGTIVTITCSDGYTIEGNQELTCQTDQTWDNPWPTCPPPTTPRPCRLYVCYIGVYVAVLSALVILVVYFIVRCLFEILCGVDFFVKIVLPSCCCMLICIVCVVAICIPVEPDCDAGVGIGVPIVIVIILHPCVTVGVIVCHFKYCMVVEASDEDGDKQNEIKKDENLTTNQKNGDPTDRHKKVQASHL